MTTSAEFLKAGVRGQTFVEIKEKFGKPIFALSEDDVVMFNYALAFAWVREREHLQVSAAYDKAMNMTTAEVEALFEDEKDPEVKAATDFDSQPPTTMP